MSDKPSFDLKLDRAEKHLVDLKELVVTYTDRHPYEVRKTVEGKKQRTIFRLAFTEQPPDDIALVAADFVNNVRAALDHIAGALVPANKRRSVMFPIFFPGVWEKGRKWENKQRRKDRERWRTYTRSMHPDAVAILQAIQPPEPARDSPETVDGLAILNAISNTDRHTKLPAISHTLTVISGRMLYSDGVWYAGGPTDTAPHQGIKHGTPLIVPKGVVEVQFRGTPRVLLDIGRNVKTEVWLPGPLDHLLSHTRDIFDLLRPYLWVKP